jgi:NADH-quinone oxidoreductase subunit M
LKAVLHGPLNKRWSGHLQEISQREMIVIIPLMVLILLIGLWPSWILSVINQAVVTWSYIPKF